MAKVIRFKVSVSEMFDCVVSCYGEGIAGEYWEEIGNLIETGHKLNYIDTDSVVISLMVPDPELEDEEIIDYTVMPERLD